MGPFVVELEVAGVAGAGVVDDGGGESVVAAVAVGNGEFGVEVGGGGVGVAVEDPLQPGGGLGPVVLCNGDVGPFVEEAGFVVESGAAVGDDGFGLGVVTGFAVRHGQAGVDVGDGVVVAGQDVLVAFNGLGPVAAGDGDEGPFGVQRRVATEPGTPRSSDVFGGVEVASVTVSSGQQRVHVGGRHRGRIPSNRFQHRNYCIPVASSRQPAGLSDGIPHLGRDEPFPDLSPPPAGQFTNRTDPTTGPSDPPDPLDPVDPSQCSDPFDP